MLLLSLLIHSLSSAKSHVLAKSHKDLLVRNWDINMIHEHNNGQTWMLHKRNSMIISHCACVCLCVFVYVNVLFSGVPQLKPCHSDRNVEQFVLAIMRQTQTDWKAARISVCRALCPHKPSCDSDLHAKLQHLQEFNGSTSLHCNCARARVRIYKCRFAMARLVLINIRVTS